MNIMSFFVLVSFPAYCFTDLKFSLRRSFTSSFRFVSSFLWSCCNLEYVPDLVCCMFVVGYIKDLDLYELILYFAPLLNLLFLEIFLVEVWRSLISCHLQIRVVWLLLCFISFKFCFFTLLLQIILQAQY